MKSLIKKCALFVIMTLAITSCRKTDLAPMSPVSQASNYNSELKPYHSGTTDSDGGVIIFTDKDKCKKCHSGKATINTWDAPFMNDNRYNSIEELIANYDFVNNVHLSKKDKNSSLLQAGISEEQKQELIEYLKNLAASSKADN